MKFSQIAAAIRRGLGIAENLVDEITVTGEDRADWQLNAYGGGKITLTNVTKAEALEQAMKLGTVTFVDDTHHFMFYRPPGFSGNLPPGI